MPIHKTRQGSSGRVGTEWHENMPGQDLNIPQGGGERSKSSEIEKKIAKVVEKQGNASTMNATELANYILQRQQIDPRLNPIKILNQSKLPIPLHVRVAALIKFAQMKNEREETEE